MNSVKLAWRIQSGTGRIKLERRISCSIRRGTGGAARRLYAALLVIVAQLLVCITCLAQDVTIYGALTTDYVFRGVSNSDGDPAAQIGVDVSGDSGFFGGVWASTIDITTAGRQRSLEVDYYLGFMHQFNDEWNATVSINRYTYPVSDSGIDYDYTEFSALFGYRDRLWIGFDYTDSLFGHDAEATNVEILASWPLRNLFSLSAGIGFFDVSELADRGYWHWQAGISRPVAWVDMDLRYFDTRKAPARISQDDLADPRLVFTLSVAF